MYQKTTNIDASLLSGKSNILSQEQVLKFQYPSFPLLKWIFRLLVCMEFVLMPIVISQNNNVIVGGGGGVECKPYNNP